MRKMQAAAVFTLATLALAACGSSDENSATLNDQNAQAVGAALAAQASAMPASFTANGLASSGGLGGFLAPQIQAVAAVAGVSVPQLTLGPCPAVDDQTDADGDGVLDNATYTFLQVDCTSTGYWITGSITISDPSNTAVGYTATYNDMLLHLDGQNQGDFFEVGLDGSHGVLGTSSSATLTENLRTTLDLVSGNQQVHGSFTNNWSISFTSDQGGDIAMDGNMPDGGFNMNGSWVYNVQGERLAMQIQTVTPLAYSAACEGQLHPFTGGEVRAHAGNANSSIYVRITYTGCGVDPTVEFFGSGGGNNT